MNVQQFWRIVVFVEEKRTLVSEYITKINKMVDTVLVVVREPVGQTKKILKAKMLLPKIYRANRDFGNMV